MKRTQVYIDWETWRRAKAAAARRGQTVSELIRKTLASAVRSDRTKNSLDLLYEFSKKYKDKWPKDTPKNLSTTVDRYLYAPSTPAKKRKT
ncbi:hypothetical protein HYV22_03285 [Candidatus Gottesmanbacteria bacterium]|nr:hypothetical protein [Candidatus Gottesmanbacteria bacterium]